MTPRTRAPLALDREHRKFLGVCAGLANYLEVEAWTVRLVFLGCLIFGMWFLLPLVYFGLWFVLDDSSTKVREAVVESHLVAHFKNVDYKKKLYRNTEEGKVLGVCAGIADYLEVSVFTVRVVLVLLVLFTVFPAFFYFGAALVLDKKPAGLYHHEAASAAQAQADAPGPGSDPRRMHEHFSTRVEFPYYARKFATLQARLARIEAYVTSPRFHLRREFRNMS
jgi:phage shock protein C